MGFSNCGIALAVLYGLCQIYRDVFTTIQFGQRFVDYTLLFECVSGFGLGGSAIALFGRVGGGILPEFRVGPVERIVGPLKFCQDQGQAYPIITTTLIVVRCRKKKDNCFPNLHARNPDSDPQVLMSAQSVRVCVCACVRACMCARYTQWA